MLYVLQKLASFCLTRFSVPFLPDTHVDEWNEIETGIQKLNKGLENVRLQAEGVKKRIPVDAGELDRLIKDLLTFQQCLEDLLKRNKEILIRTKIRTEIADSPILLLSPEHNPDIKFTLIGLSISTISFIGGLLLPKPINLWFIKLNYVGMAICFLNGIYMAIKFRQKYGSIISYPPATSLMKIARFLYSEKTYKLSFETTFADFYEEYFQALQKGEKYKAKWINFCYQVAFFKIVLLRIALELKDFLQILCWK